MKKISFTVVALTLIVLSCSKGSDSPSANNSGSTSVDCSTIDSRFSAVVFPIIQNSCNTSGCHNAGSSNGPGALTTYAQIQANAGSIRASVLSGSMPKNGVLTTAQKNAISCWVQSGAPNN